MHMSLLTTIHLSHGHVVTTILHSVAAVHRGHHYAITVDPRYVPELERMAQPLALPLPARVRVGPSYAFV